MGKLSEFFKLHFDPEKQKIVKDQEQEEVESVFDGDTYTWSIEFELTGNVNDFDLAKEYLLEDTMLNYYSGIAKKYMRSIDWVLQTPHSGKVFIRGQLSYMSERLAEQLLSFINEQNSDGLGEGFEQQEFAEIDLGNDEYTTVGFKFIEDPNFILENN